MKKLVFILLTGILFVNDLNAQAPQFAVVRPDGTTYICPSWDSAYNKANNGDNIYLPGVTITSQFYLNKRLFIYGAGHHPDSTNATGKTTISNSIIIQSGASGGSLEGIQVSNFMFFQYTDRKIQDYTIKRCRSNNIHFTDGYTPFDSLPTNIRITESVFSSTDGSGSSGISFSKNLIAFNVNNFVSSDFFNNTFLYTSNSLNGITYSNIRNNIFLTSHVFNSNTSCTNSFSNNLKINGCGLLCGCPFNTGVEAGTISVSSTNDIFISYVGSFPYIDNYHLKPTCPGVNAGTDGTDVGIYGTSQPTSEGWVPSNPHIYFKQVAPQTNSNGQLPIQFKVRTGN